MYGALKTGLAGSPIVLASIGDIAKNMMSLKFILFGIKINLSEPGAALQSIIQNTFTNNFADAPGLGSVGGIASIVSEVTEQIAFQLLVLFFVLHTINVVIREGERFGWERCLMLAVRLALYKMLLSCITPAIAMFFNLFDDMTQHLITTSETVPDIGDSVKDLIDVDGGFIEKWIVSLANFGMFLVYYIIFISSLIGMIGQALYRSIRISIYEVCAPIGVAVGMMDEGGGTARRVYMQAVALGLEGMMIIFLINLYKTGYAGLAQAASVADNKINFLSAMLGTMVLNQLMTLGLSNVGQIAERLVS